MELFYRVEEEEVQLEILKAAGNFELEEIMHFLEAVSIEYSGIISETAARMLRRVKRAHQI